jgi:uncharacterized delta-60 repeat protein
MRIRAFTIMAVVAICLPAVSGARGPRSGALDPSFGSRGRVILHPSATSQAASAVVQPDEKIVLAGYVHDGYSEGVLSNNDFLAVRLTRNGGLDRSFGSSGFVRTTIDLGGGDSRRVDMASAVALSPDGGIVLAGTAKDYYRSVPALSSVLALARYTPSGSLDTSFAGDGIKTIDPNPAGDEGLGGVAVQPDGKIVAVGGAGSGFLVLRLRPDGALDETFGSGGMVNTNLGGSFPDAASAVAILGDGKIVVAGSADFDFNDQARQDVGVARYLPNGLLDSTFGAGGVVVTPGAAAEAGCGVAATSGDKILVVGTGSIHTYRGYFDTSWFRLVRYLPSGALDAGFGDGGVVATFFAGNYASACSVAIQRDGRILAGGTAAVPLTEGSAKLALARYTSGGRLDETFSGDGKRIYDLRAGNDFATALALQRHAARSGADRLVLAGASQRQPDGLEHDVSAIGIDLGAQPMRCRVPNVVGSTLARAKARIRSAHCRVGRVRHARSSRPRGRVVSQRPRAGRILPLRSRVALVVSRGR